MYSPINDAKPPPVSRTTSLCPTPEEKLLEVVLANNTDEIEEIINDKLLTHQYVDYNNKPILLIACIEENVNVKTVNKLINSGADLRHSDENQWEALHFAAKRANKSILEAVINGLKYTNNDLNINTVLAEGSNALHILIRYGNKNSDDFTECAKLLIKEGIDVNLPDNKLITPILWAAKNNLKDIIKVIIEESDFVDLDTYKSRGLTARDLIINKELYDKTLPERIDNNNPESSVNLENVNVLFNYVKLGDESGFIRRLNGDTSSVINADNGNDTLLQLSVDKGCFNIVKYLIDKGVDIYATPCKNKKLPIEIAAEHAFYDIFSILLQNTDKKIPVTVLITLLKSFDNESFHNINNNKCLEALFKKIDKNTNILDINEVDESNNSPLHYAIRYTNNDIINNLLNKGASLGVKNNYDIMPIEDIEPDLLEKHLDNCIQFDYNVKKDKQDFEIIFDYKTLIPRTKLTNPELGVHSDEIVGESEVISYMSTSSEYKHLLKHPVIVSFLYMKWHRIRFLFYMNLFVYIAFFLSLITYIFVYYANFHHINNDYTKIQLFIQYLSYITLLVTFFILSLRELLQFIILPYKYFNNFENYIDIMLLILSGCLLFINNPSVDLRKELSSISILFSAFELILMVGQHPKLSTNVVMLKTVSYNFFKFFLWYCLLIIAFALSFYILFTPVTVVNIDSNKTEEKEDNFSNAGNSIFKTIVMLTGEFDASDMNFKTFPVISKLLFVLFIFMIAIILLNLLNGLAVSDTQLIKNNAELLGHIYRAQRIRYVEIMLSGNIVPIHFINKINLCCCLPFTKDLNFNMFKFLASKICLFPRYFKNYEIVVYPNKKGQVLVPVKKKINCWCPSLNWFFNVYLDKETNKRAIEIVRLKKEERNFNMNNKKDESEIALLKNKINQLEGIIESLSKVIESNKIRI